MGIARTPEGACYYIGGPAQETARNPTIRFIERDKTMTPATRSKDTAASSTGTDAAPPTAGGSTAMARRLNLPPPPPFTGTGQEPEAWLAALRRVGPAQGWSPDDDPVVIPALLGGIAAVWYDQLSDDVKTDPDRLRKALIATFSRTGATTAAREELYLRRQRPSESVTELAVAIGDLCYRADPRMTPADRVSHLLQALHPELRRLLAATLPENPTWDQVVAAAKRIEAIGPAAPPFPLTGANAPKAEANAINDDSADLRRRITALEALLAATSSPPSSSHSPPARDDQRSRPTCQRCGKFGHTANVCRAPAPRDDRQASFNDRQAHFSDRQTLFNNRQAPFNNRQAPFNDRYNSSGSHEPQDSRFAQRSPQPSKTLN